MNMKEPQNFLLKELESKNINSTNVADNKHICNDKARAREILESIARNSVISVQKITKSK